MKRKIYIAIFIIAITVLTGSGTAYAITNSINISVKPDSTGYSTVVVHQNGEFEQIQTDEEAVIDFENHIKSSENYISNNGVDLKINGKLIDFSKISDSRSDKSISFKDFMNSSVPKDFIMDAESKTILAVRESDTLTINDFNTKLRINQEESFVPNSNINTCSPSTPYRSVDSCLLRSPENIGFWGDADDYGNWNDSSAFRDYQNYNAQIDTNEYGTIAGIVPGNTFIFDRATTVTHVILF